MSDMIVSNPYSRVKYHPMTWGWDFFDHQARSIGRGLDSYRASKQAILAKILGRRFETFPVGFEVDKLKPPLKVGL